VAGVVFALTLFAWPIRAISRRAHRAPFPYEGERKRAYRIAPLAALLILAYFGAWAWFLTWVLESLSGAGSRLPLTVLYIAGVVPLAVVAGTAWVNRVLWRGHAKWFSKAWAVLLLLSSLVALWFAIAMRFYSFDFTF
jgi:hypothetical protein